MVNSTSESLNTAKPSVDCVFPYIRINIALDEIAGLGTTITIRKNADHLRASEERMLSTNQASKEMLDFWRSCESQNEYFNCWSNRNRENGVYEVPRFSYTKE